MSGLASSYQPPSPSVAIRGPFALGQGADAAYGAARDAQPAQTQEAGL